MTELIETIKKENYEIELTAVEIPQTHDVNNTEYFVDVFEGIHNTTTRVFGSEAEARNYIESM